MTPEQAKLQAQIDQGFTLITGNFPPLWRKLYTNLVSEGFNEVQALALVKAYILSQCPSGIRGSDA
jgi:hypothetical protein